MVGFRQLKSAYEVAQKLAGDELTSYLAQLEPDLNELVRDCLAGLEDTQGFLSPLGESLQEVLARRQGDVSGMSPTRLTALPGSDSNDICANRRLAAARDISCRDAVDQRFHPLLPRSPAIDCLKEVIDPADQPGSLGIFGDYRVLGVLGVGGMGVVFRAEDMLLQRVVALKVMRPEVSSEKDSKERFLREGRAAAKVSDSRVVVIHRVSEHRGVPFLVMPLLLGQSLAQRLKSDVPIEILESVRLSREIAEGLATAHLHELIHRDLKPDNIWLEETRDGTHVRILDFGLAREIHAAALTLPGMILGTPGYMSPEQASSSVVDERADLFSLGCILYEMVTRKRPFARDTLHETLAATERHEPPAPADLDSSVSIELSHLIMRLLSKSPDARPESASRVVAELRDAESAILGDAQSSARHNVAFLKRKWTWLAPIVVATALLAMVVATAKLTPGRKFWNNTIESLRTPATPESRQISNAMAANHHLASVSGIAAGGTLDGAQTAGQEWNENSLQMKFCWCPEGRYLRGSPPFETNRIDNEEQIAAQISGFWIGKHEVTQSEWGRVMKTTLDDQRRLSDPSHPIHGEGPEYPMYYVCHGDAEEFCRRMTQQERSAGKLPKEWSFCLPSEAQWEYACRAGTDTMFSFGDEPELMNEFGSCRSGDLRQAQPVGRKRANSWGIHDMHGNVFEMCRDYYQQRMSGGSDPTTLSYSPTRVIRGGSWDQEIHRCRCAYRSAASITHRSYVIGFRVAISRFK